eukprot:TRINITY_DN4788_c0_g1_i2.p1 TRINITY_DN4788_c0_g1~~TRINITY_DN4788_c0_g1_i2.p1  ORF type:complete len:331 (+),score=17.82 TRINITY_DN4788_c0_g1_i2:46-993(+)
MAGLPEPLLTLYFFCCILPLLLPLLALGVPSLVLLSPIILVRRCFRPRPWPLKEEFRELAIAIDEGTGTGSNVLVFLHGWPDSADVWRAQIDHFVEKGFRCIALEMPNYGAHGERCLWGYDYDTLAVMVGNTLRRLKAGSGIPAILVGHDLGAFIGYIVERSQPTLLRALVSFDVSPAPNASLGICLAVIAYQLHNVLVFLLSLVPIIGPLIADFLFRAFVVYVLPPLGNWGFPGTQLCPTHVWHDLKANCCYSYYYLWRSCNMPGSKMFSLGYKGWKVSADSLAGELPCCPTYKGSRTTWETMVRGAQQATRKQ